jgi:hypothetical protein
VLENDRFDKRTFEKYDWREEYLVEKKWPLTNMAVW